MATWTRLQLGPRRQRDIFPMFSWYFRFTLTAICFSCVQLGHAIRKNVMPPEGVTLNNSSLGREADCKGKANLTCDNIW